jgi:peptide/nickel transport system substrate-binding protein
MRFGIGEALFKYNDIWRSCPGMAESYETADYTTWTIKLKEGVTFSNGTPMTATKVKESLDWSGMRAPTALPTPEVSALRWQLSP